MLISFFEEFPDKVNLSKLKYVNWPTKLYLAAKNLEEFNKIKSRIKNRNIKEIIYWPILKKEDGYWISPFSRRKALKKTFDELKNTPLPVMVDAELPTTQNPSLYYREWFNFFFNRRTIRKFIKGRKKIYVAEYYPQSNLMNKTMSFLGLHFNPNKYGCKTIKMVYHSMHKFDKEFITNKLSEGVKQYKSNYLVANGTISKGIMGNEPVLSFKQLKEDLKIAKKAGIREVVIYRLCGLNQKYARIIKTFTR